MDIYRTEEEQVAALKKWWGQNGKSLIIGILVALSAVFVWKSWEQKQVNEKSAASVLYQQLLESALTDQRSEEQKSSVSFIGNKLKTEFENTQYAVFAAMFMARDAAEGADLVAAEQQLKWADAHAAHDHLKAVIQVRLAKVVAAQGREEEAVKLLEKSPNPQMTAIYAEARGDIYFAKGDKEAAKEAYSAAYKASDESSGNLGILQVKLADLGVLAEDL